MDDFSETDLTDLSWDEDILGAGYRAATLDLGEDPDGEGTAVATLVRADHAIQATGEDPTARPALLWVHGMSDYFFHTHVAERCAEEGYPSTPWTCASAGAPTAPASTGTTPATSPTTTPSSPPRRGCWRASTARWCRSPTPLAASWRRCGWTTCNARIQSC